MVVFHSQRAAMRPALIVLAGCLLLASAASAFPEPDRQDFPSKYREFLDLTKYIRLPQEEETFLDLGSERERDIFIELFWKQRDPTPGTPQNEYKDQHIERFEHANRRYGFGASRPGWMTDMGRIYIILGEPRSVERFEATHGLYPTQVWYYYGSSGSGLPAHFGLVFYQRDGAGEYKLYDPVVDGPASLMIETRHADPTNFRDIYMNLREIAPTLAPISISMIVGQTPIDFQPTPESTILMADILESPRKDINPTYATHFLEYKGMVSTEYMTNYITNDTQVITFRDPVTGLDFVHFAISPRHLTVQYYEPDDRYFCSFSLDVSLRKDERIIHQYSREFPIYFDPDRYEFVSRNGLALEDSFPAVPGRYELVILARNTVGKEFTLHENPLVIPAAGEGPSLDGPFFGYQVRDYPTDMHFPFKGRRRKLVIDPKNTFGAGDEISFFAVLQDISPELWKSGRIEADIFAVGKERRRMDSIRLPLARFPYHAVLDIFQVLSTANLPPEYYEMEMRFMDGADRVLDSSKGLFIISAAESVSHPVAHAKGIKFSDHYSHVYTVADQYGRLGNPKQARIHFEKAYRMNPDYTPGLIQYAHFLFSSGDFLRILELVEPLAGNEKRRFEYYLLKGKALMGLERYDEAIQDLQAGNAIYNSDVGLLNSLGICYYRKGRLDDAREVLTASLKLDPDQPETRKLLELIEKNRD